MVRSLEDMIMNSEACDNKIKKGSVYYPIFLNIQGKPCLVIGGGAVALRKIKHLLECGAKVKVISPAVRPEISRLTKKRMIQLVKRDFRTGDLKNSIMAMVCTDSKKVNRKAADEATKAGVLVNVADDPDQSDFILPSFFRRGDLTVAISTSGLSPALAKKIRSTLEKGFGDNYAALLSVVGEVRAEIKKEGVAVEAQAWQAALNSNFLTRLKKASSREKAKALLLKKLIRTRKTRQSPMLSRIQNE